MDSVRTEHGSCATCALLVVMLATAATAFAQGGLPAQERKKIHDQQFSGIGGEIDRQLAATNRDVTFDAYEPGWGEPSNGALRPLLDLYACNANAVIIGTSKASTSEATASGTTVYTTWTVQAEDVLKFPIAAQLQWGSTIEVLANGGSIVRPGGRRVTVKSRELPDGLDSAHRYLMFLRLIPETGAYRLTTIFTVDGEFAKSHPAGRYPTAEKVRSDDLLMATRNMVSEVLIAGNCAK